MKQPQFILSSRDSWKEKELLVLGFFEGEDPPGVSLRETMLLRVYSHFPSLKEDFKGKLGEKNLLHLPERDFVFKKILFVGLGKKEKFDLEQHREIAAQIAQYVRNSGIKSFSVEVFGDPTDADRVRATVEGMGLGLYQFKTYKKPSEDSRDIEKVNLLVDQTEEVKKAFEEGEILVENVCFVRDLVNEPPNVMTPRELSKRAREIADNSGGKIRTEILDKNDLTELGMNLILAVGQASQNEPCLIKMEYKPEKVQNSGAPYVLVGKGVCFDSGGLDIKSAGGMADMKNDMAGGAAVLGAIKAIAALDLPVWIVGLVPAVENSVSGTAYRPGDILKAYNGRTIEIGHTDAEGRLILFDALAYAKGKYRPCLIIDIATLTGTCKDVFGHHYAGLFGSSPDIVERLKLAGKEAEDKVWELPLDKKYLKDMEGKIADLSNLGSGSSIRGPITAACFLREAVGEDQPWAHIDCAGPVFLGSSGATGFGVRLFIQFFLNQLKKKSRKK